MFFSFLVFQTVYLVKNSTLVAQLYVRACTAKFLANANVCNVGVGAAKQKEGEKRDEMLSAYTKKINRSDNVGLESFIMRELLKLVFSYMRTNL